MEALGHLFSVLGWAAGVAGGGLELDVLDVKNHRLAPSEGLLVDGGDGAADVLLARCPGQDHDRDGLFALLLQDCGDADVFVSEDLGDLGEDPGALGRGESQVVSRHRVTGGLHRQIREG